MMGTLIALLIMWSYLSWYAVKYGIPPSISQTALKLPTPFIFMAVMWTVGFLVMPTMIEKCIEGTEFLAFLTMAGMMFVGATPLGKNCNEAVHMCGAIAFGVCSQLMLALNAPWLLSVWVPILAFLVVVVRWKNYVFWLEVACIADLLIYCLI